ncbi:RNA binding motif protein 2 [Echinococcus multilocularis]|uniref:RNA binding motif protein 2 n=1 Tax=Echinococcus multilocularis TaxID=6211 RepID=A0A068Y3R7_ECHMU|nr:RNA binding motif protein 2 [Echinococcus multilocularis]
MSYLSTIVILLAHVSHPFCTCSSIVITALQFELLKNMNPITQTKNQNAMNERELHLGYTGTESSWHRQYRDSAWIFVGGLSYDLTEGDVICVFSQYGEIANINLVRDRDSGRSRGFAFVCYENQKSTILATDNLNGIKLAGRTIRVDHVEKYKVPTTGVAKVGRQDANQVPLEADAGEFPSVTDYVREHGCGPEAMRRILELQKVNKTSQESPLSTGYHMDRSPSPPRGSHRLASQNCSPYHRRSPSVSPPRRTERHSTRGHSSSHQRFGRSPEAINASTRRRLGAYSRNVSIPGQGNRLTSSYVSPHHSRHRERSRSSPYRRKLEL